MKVINLDFIIIGAQKSGSTYLQKICSEHPMVFTPNSETTIFEFPEWNQKSKDAFNVRLSIHSHLVKGIKRPNYLCNVESPSLIKNHTREDIKLIVCLRSPIDRFISAYYHYINMGYFPPVPIKQGLQLLLEKKLPIKYKRGYEVLDFGYYGKGIERYLTLFKRENILILFFDDIRNSPDFISRSVYEFIGVDKGFIPVKSGKRKPMKTMYSIHPIKNILQSLSTRIGNTYNSDRTRNVRRKNIVMVLIAKFLSLLIELFFSSQKPNLDKETKEHIMKFYRDDISKLEGLIDVDLTHWKN